MIIRLLSYGYLRLADSLDLFCACISRAQAGLRAYHDIDSLRFLVRWEAILHPFPGRVDHIESQLQSIINHPGDEHTKEGAGLFKAGVSVNLNEPRLQGLVDDEIVTEDLEAELPPLRVELGFHWPECVLDYRLDGSIDDIAELQVYPLRPQLHTALLERKLISLLEGTVVIIELLHGIVG